MNKLKALTKWLVIGILLISTVSVVGGYAISPNFTVTRSVLVDAAADKVFALVADPRGWKQWSVWNQRDPAMSVEYSGPASGVGAAWVWDSKTEGKGKMTLTAAEPGERVAFELYFPDFDTTSNGELRFAASEGATQVTWTMNGDMGSNPLSHWFALFVDNMVGKDFEAGLANLKTLAESPTSPMQR